MNEQTQQLIQAIHDAPHQIVFVAAGAGSLALADLLSVAGASRTLLEALIPYSEASFDEFLGQTPDKYVTPEVASLLAGRAYARARQLAAALPAAGPPVIGLACTATISTDRPKRGDHRAHIATWQQDSVAAYDVYLEKGGRSRHEEEVLISNLMLNALAHAVPLKIQLPVTVGGADRLVTRKTAFGLYVNQIVQGTLTCLGIGANGRILSAVPRAILAGAFNPLHEGHIKLALAASHLLNTPVAFECTAVNADKPPLSATHLLTRIAQFAGRWPIWLSTAPTFVEKSRLYPGATFVVGYDTAVRVLHARYYQHSQEKLLAALAEIRANKCAFLVAGRVGPDNFFHEMEELPVPPSFKDLFSGIPPQHFREDVSSTDLRARKQLTDACR